jgi:hypothetical protein
VKSIVVALGVAILCAANLASADPAPASDTSTPPATTHKPQMVEHRYLVERTFPAGALDGLNSSVKASVNATNAKYGVRWVTSYANSDKTKTYCIYEGPNELAIRSAATANKLPVDSITEVPVTLSPK